MCLLGGVKPSGLWRKYGVHSIALLTHLIKMCRSCKQTKDFANGRSVPRKPNWTTRPSKRHSADQGVTDPQNFGRLVQQRQDLEVQLKELDQSKKDQDLLYEENQRQWQRVLEARKTITGARAEFVAKTLKTKHLREN